MKSAGIDGLVADTEPSSVFALAAALDQQGVKLKATMLATGGGGDLIDSGPTAIQAAQGDDFLSDFEPPEMHTPATRHFRLRWRSMRIHRDPTFAEYMGYLSILGLVQGLKAPDRTRPKLRRYCALPHHRLECSRPVGWASDGQLEPTSTGRHRVLLDDQAEGTDLQPHLRIGSGVRHPDQGQERLGGERRAAGRTRPAARRPAARLGDPSTGYRRGAPIAGVRTSMPVGRNVPTTAVGPDSGGRCTGSLDRLDQKIAAESLSLVVVRYRETGQKNHPDLVPAAIHAHSVPATPPGELHPS